MMVAATPPGSRYAATNDTRRPRRRSALRARPARHHQAPSGSRRVSATSTSPAGRARTTAASTDAPAGATRSVTRSSRPGSQEPARSLREFHDALALANDTLELTTVKGTCSTFRRYAGAMADHVDFVLEQWAAERPDLDMAPMGVVGRLLRLTRRIDAELDRTFSAHGLDRPAFDVLATLRRAGSPHRLAGPAHAGLDGHLRRHHPAPRPARAPRARDTEPERAGLRRRRRCHPHRRGASRLIDAALPDHVANEQRLLAHTHARSAQGSDGHAPPAPGITRRHRRLTRRGHESPASGAAGSCPRGVPRLDYGRAMSEELFARLAAIDTTCLADAGPDLGVLPRELRPVGRAARLVGRAVTVDARSDPDVHHRGDTRSLGPATCWSSRPATTSAAPRVSSSPPRRSVAAWPGSSSTAAHATPRWSASSTWPSSAAASPRTRRARSRCRASRCRSPSATSRSSRATSSLGDADGIVVGPPAAVEAALEKAEAIQPANGA